MKKYLIRQYHNRIRNPFFRKHFRLLQQQCKIEAKLDSVNSEMEREEVLDELIACLNKQVELVKAYEV